MSQDAQRFKQTFCSRLRRVLLAGLAFYVLVCIGCASFQRRLIYHPTVLASGHVGQLAQEANLERWTNSSGQLIGMKRLSPKQPADGIVLITYGNASSATGSAHYADEIQNIAAFDIFILEYPGYEDRSGSPSQSSLFRAADGAFQMLPTNKPVYLVGESLGSGVASHLAGTYPDKIAGLVLLSPFNSLTSVGQNRMPILPVWLLLVDRFPSEKYLRNYHGKVGITVDGNDQVVPEKFGLRLYDSYAGPKKLWDFPNGAHTQIMEPTDKFWNEVVEFWRSNQTFSPVK